MSQLEGTHPVRKVLHMQSCYPETIRLLSDKERTVSSAYGRRAKNQTSRSGPFPAPQPPISSRWIRGPPHKAQSSSFAANSSKGEDASDQIRRRAAHEYDFCHRKMAHNRAKGHEARVDGILTGTSPLTANIPLFPAHATHQQLSGLVRRPSYPDRPAPVVPRERKWLGDSVGWEGERRVRRQGKRGVCVEGNASYFSFSLVYCMRVKIDRSNGFSPPRLSRSQQPITKLYLDANTRLSVERLIIIAFMLRRDGAIFTALA